MAWIYQCLTSAVPLHTVHLLEVLQEVTSSDITASYFWVRGPINTSKRLRARQEGFFKCRKSALEVPITLSCSWTHGQGEDAQCFHEYHGHQLMYHW